VERNSFFSFGQALICENQQIFDKGLR